MSVITRIEIQALPPSVNAMYATNTKTGRRFKTKISMAFDQIASFMTYSGPKLLPNIPYRAELDFYGDWHCKDGSIRKKDLDNLGKQVLDVLVKFSLEWDDSQIIELRMRKVNKGIGREKTVIRLYPLGRSESIE